MSELITNRNNRKDFHRQLLRTVSTLALLGAVYGARTADAADDTDHPTVWIELGGQLEAINGSEERFAPPFLLTMPRPAVQTISPLSVERAPRFSNGAEGRISFEPAGTDWVLSMSVLYGRSNGNKHVHQQTYPKSVEFTSGGTEVPRAARSSDTKAQDDESHAVVDFQAGKDIGLGVFGIRGSSILSLGVRFAQFNTQSNAAIKSDPDWRFGYKYIRPGYNRPFGNIYHSNAGSAKASRSFRGIGPSLSWNASAPFVGNLDSEVITFDWGANAAALFGRQKAITHHQTTAHYFHSGLHAPYQHVTLYRHAPPSASRTHSVLVPNVGAFAGLSLRFPNAKVSLGYRGDFFFGAMDGGIDTARREDRDFYGPFATISIGVGG